MWPFQKHTLRDFINELIKKAREAEKDLDSVYEGDKEKKGQILEVIDAIIEVEEQQEHYLQTLREPKLIEEWKTIKHLTINAKEEADREQYDDVKKLIHQVIKLERYFKHHAERQLRQVKKVVGCSSKEAKKAGVLYRGLSPGEYDHISNSESILAKQPRGDVNLIRHITDPTNNPSQYISLTTDVETAKHFGEGRVVAIDKNKLRGHLLDSKGIKRKTAGDTRAKKLQVKNTEYVLEPSKKQLAEIPPESVMALAA